MRELLILNNSQILFVKKCIFCWKQNYRCWSNLEKGRFRIRIWKKVGSWSSLNIRSRIPLKSNRWKYWLTKVITNYPYVKYIDFSYWKNKVMNKFRLVGSSFSTPLGSATLVESRLANVLCYALLISSTQVLRNVKVGILYKGFKVHNVSYTIYT